MALAPRYRKSNYVNANYDYLDIASGAGIITFYGAIDQSGNGILTTNSNIASDDIETRTVGGAGVRIDKDFDVTVNKPMTLRGIMYAHVPMKMGYVASTHNAYIIVKLRKWDGAAETEIASGTSSTTQVAVADGLPDHDPIKHVKITIPTTVFKQGETIRVTLHVYDDVGTEYVAVAFDPRNRVSAITKAGDPQYFTGSMNTQFICNIPIKIVL